MLETIKSDDEGRRNVPTVGEEKADGPLVIPELLTRELDYLAGLGDNIGEQVRDIRAMLLAASERHIVLSPETQRLLEQLRPAVREGMEVRLLREIGDLGAVKTAIYQDGVQITSDQMVVLRAKVDKPPSIGEDKL